MKPILQTRRPISMPRADMLTVLKRLGLAGSLSVCLDAGHASSYTSGQQWSDLSGNGNHFNRGATSGATTDDPTFNGTADRRSSGEYFGLDGGDYCDEVSDGAWDTSWHKASATFTALMWVYKGSGGSQVFFGNRDVNDVTSLGVVVYNTAGDALRFRRANGSANVNADMGGIPNAAWCMIGVSVNEAGGANASHHRINGAFSLFNGSMTSPSGSSPAAEMTLGADSTHSAPLTNNSRIAAFMAWNGVALTPGQTAAIFHATRQKFGV